MLEESSLNLNLVVFADGSCRPTNPGFGGYGLFGYTYKHTLKPKNTKHPIKAALSFTSSGVERSIVQLEPEKEDKPSLAVKPEPAGSKNIEVIDIVEAAIAEVDPRTTNNAMELKAALHAMQWADDWGDIAHLLIITDSRYFVNNFTDHLKTWASKGFKRQDGMIISNVEVWGAIESIRNKLEDKGVKIQVKWVKGHSDDYGNEMADVLSVIGSNAARVQTQSGAQFSPVIINTKQSYANYKASYNNKDIVYYFKDLFFSSAVKADEDLCFLSTTEDEPNVGRRSTDSIFIVNKGYVPPLINRLKAFYRAQRRNYNCICSIRLQRLENRDILRLADNVDVAYLLLPLSKQIGAFSLVGTSEEFIKENTMEYPFIVNISKLTNAISNMLIEPESSDLTVDILDDIIESGKLKITNKDKFVDLSKTIEGKLEFCQRPLVGVGYDIPAYLTLKKLEDEIVSVQAVFSKAQTSNFYTLYTKIALKDRELCSVNMLDKYLAKSVVNKVSL